MTMSTIIDNGPVPEAWRGAAAETAIPAVLLVVHRPGAITLADRGWASAIIPVNRQRDRMRLPLANRTR